MKQHKKACKECPWRKKALQGWLGSNTPQEWLEMAHGESKVSCHTLGNKLLTPESRDRYEGNKEEPQCAGMAIYRRNMCKIPKDKELLVLPADRETIFSNPMEFLKHHLRK